MKRTPRTLPALLALATTLGWGTQARAAWTSPGPLARSHAKHDNDCNACHTAGKGVVDAKCLKCHENVNKRPFHRKQALGSGKACATCHRDHRGRDFRMIRWRPPHNFDHRKTGCSLRGAHRKAECAGCHKTPDRWMGLKSTCTSCHTDPHKPSLGTSCATCHSERAFAPAPRFSHTATRFPLKGAHRRVQCVDCHSKPPAGKTQPRPFRGLPFTACSDCHDEPVANHSQQVACKTCHEVRQWRLVKPDAGQQLHAKTSFPLTGKHKEVRCSDCHTNRQKRGAQATFAGRLKLFEGLKNDCAGCHKDPHQQRFGSACADCHGTSSWGVPKKRIASRSGSVEQGGHKHGNKRGTPQRFVGHRSFDHSKTRFALRGKHKRVDCTGCHPAKGSYQRRFRDIAHDKCADCHKQVHDGKFVSVVPSDTCESCHTEAGFRPATFDNQRHQETRFKLTGRHVDTDCAGCHKKPRSSAPAQLVGTPDTCASCHETPHGKQFQDKGTAAACDTCHTIAAFSPAMRFDHAKTAFPLVGPHADTDCASCHVKPNASAPVQFEGTPAACASCHADTHAGQFAQNGPAKTCEDCHRVVAGFDIPKFPHNEQTRFALVGEHAKATCEACHKQVVAPNGERVTHYRLGPLPCGRCHTDPHSFEKGPK